MSILLQSNYDAPHMVAARAAGRAWQAANPTVQDCGKGSELDKACIAYASSLNERGAVVVELYFAFADGATGGEE